VFWPVCRYRKLRRTIYGPAFTTRAYCYHEVLTYPAVRAPWAILGYSDQLHRAFKKDPEGLWPRLTKDVESCNDAFG
jgi:hypothetical protein